jgi:hypothetical protein
MADDDAEEEEGSLSIFKDTANSIKTLRRFYKDYSRLIDVEAFQKEVMGESDRATIILISAMLDDALSFRIAKHVICPIDDEQYDYIFRFEGPLGTFSAKMEIACLFGIIEDEVYQGLDIIREMRNACAHSRHPLTFADSAITNVAKRLSFSLGLSNRRPDDNNNLKSHFVIESMFLREALRLGSREKARSYLLTQFYEQNKHLFEQTPSPDKPI